MVLSEPVMGVCKIWLPVRGYKLKLQHRLLNELGEISHFIISALNHSTWVLNDFQLITGFSEQQIKPILQRLIGLGCLNQDGNLTNLGRSLAYILQHLHQQEVSFWLDQRYKQRGDSIIMLKGDTSLVGQYKGNDILIETEKSENNLNVDCFLQVERIRKEFSSILPWLFNDLFQVPGIDLNKCEKEWDLILEVDTERKCGWAMPFELELLDRKVKKPVLSLLTRVLTLNTHFDLANGVDFGDMNTLENNMSFQYSFLNNSLHKQLPVVVVENDKNRVMLESSSEVTDKSAAIKLLKYSNENIDDDYLVFSRQYEFTEAWLQHDVDWEQICKALADSDDLYLKEKY